VDPNWRLGLSRSGHFAQRVRAHNRIIYRCQYADSKEALQIDPLWLPILPNLRQQTRASLPELKQMEA
jgi:hypothetical protein